MSQIPPPPGPYAQPAPYPPPPPPRKRKLTGLWIALGVVAVLCCGGLGTGVFFFVKTVNDATKPVRAAATEYLDAVEVADYEHAYQLLCSSLRSEITADTLAHSAREIDHYDITSTSVSNDNGVKTGTVTVKITTQGDTSTTIFKLVKEAGDWRVCGT